MIGIFRCNKQVHAFGGGGGGGTPAPAKEYVPPPPVQTPQSQAAADTAAARATATGGSKLALAGMDAGGLTEKASTTQKSKLGG
jgi:hypothetical protein